MTQNFVRTPGLTTAMQLAEERLGRPLGDVLRELYVDQGLMQREVAEKLGIDTSTVSEWLARLGIASRPKGRGSIAAADAAR